jgi:hypothetical protein
VLCAGRVGSMLARRGSGLPLYELIVTGLQRYDGMDDVVVADALREAVIPMQSYAATATHFEDLLDAELFQV